MEKTKKGFVRFILREGVKVFLLTQFLYYFYVLFLVGFLPDRTNIDRKTLHLLDNILLWICRWPSQLYLARTAPSSPAAVTQPEPSFLLLTGIDLAGWLLFALIFLSWGYYEKPRHFRRFS